MENTKSKISSSSENSLEVLPPSKNGKGIVILGGIITFFGCMILFIPIVHILPEGFKRQYTPVIVIGALVLMIGIGLIRRYYWAWIASICIFTLSVASSIINIATRHDQKAISNAIIALLILIALAKFKNQIKRKH